MREKDAKYPEILLRTLVTTVAIAAAAVHVRFHTVIPDLMTGGLIVLAMVPWLSPLFESIEIAGFGKLAFKVNEVRLQQLLMKEQVDSLRFLITGFVTAYEHQHLIKLVGTNPFYLSKGLHSRRSVHGRTYPLEGLWFDRQTRRRLCP